jgi:Ca-activated chloride channel family protein
MPNTGQISEESLFGMMEQEARERFYTTFVGIGVDFNTELIESITKVRGANYFSVHAPSEFKKLMDDDFEYMVTPLVFDLSLKLESQEVQIEKVYGSPEADEATGKIMKVNTLFPSRTENGETKGGLVLLKLDSDPRGKEMKITTSYENRSTTRDGDEQIVEWDDINEDPYFANTGIRKGVLLSRYANLLINWLIEERSTPEQPVFDDPDFRRHPCDPICETTASGEMICSKCPIEIMPMPPFPCPLYRMDRIGICPPFPFPHERQLGQWERESQPLTIPAGTKDVFEKFKNYFGEEMEAIGDTTLNQEFDILEKLVQAPNKEREEIEKEEPPAIVDHFACGDYCPGPAEQYIKKVYEGVTDPEQCLQLGGDPQEYVGWGTTQICVVRETETKQDDWQY